MKTLLIDIEGGSASVKDKIGPELDVYSAPSYAAVEHLFWEIQKGELEADVVVIDTLTTWANTTRQDVVIDPDLIAGKSLWQNREKVMPAQRDWGVMTDL